MNQQKNIVIGICLLGFGIGAGWIVKPEPAQLPVANTNTSSKQALLIINPAASGGVRTSYASEKYAFELVLPGEYVVATNVLFGDDYLLRFSNSVDDPTLERSFTLQVSPVSSEIDTADKYRNWLATSVGLDQVGDIESYSTPTYRGFKVTVSAGDKQIQNQHYSFSTSTWLYDFRTSTISDQDMGVLLYGLTL